MQKIKFPTLPQLAALKSVSNLTITIKASAIAIAIVALYYQDLNIIFNDALQNEATSHILAIPLLFVYLLYRKRKMLRAVIPFEMSNQPRKTRHLAMLSGILLCTTAIILYWHGSYTFTPLEYHVITLPVFIGGLTLILLNPQTLRQVAFSISFLIFLTPPPSEILYGLGSTLSVISSEISNTIVNALGILSTISSEYGNPTIIITRPDKTTIGFTVDIACSGIYSLIGFLIFAAFIAYIARGKTWKKAAIFLIGLPLICTLNITRITTILLIGYYHGEQIALQMFHLLGGWTLIFLGTLLLLVVVEKILKIHLLTKKTIVSCSQGNPASHYRQNFCQTCGKMLRYPDVKLNKQDLAKICAVISSVILIISIQAPVFALTKGPTDILTQIATDQQPTTAILPQMDRYNLTFVYRDKYFEQRAKQDASLIYAYFPANSTLHATYVGLEIASSTSVLHRWEICLITRPISYGYQPDVVKLDLRDIQLLQNPPIIGRFFAFQYKRSNQTQVVLYWLETSVFSANSTLLEKYVKISLVAYPDEAENIQEVEDQLLIFGKAIANHWQPIKPWSQTALIISRNGSTLTIFSVGMLAFVFGAYIIENLREKRRDTNAYTKLARDDQKIIEAVKGSEGGTIPLLHNVALELHALDPATHKRVSKTIPTLNNIVLTYQEKNKETIDTEMLFHKLEQAEEIGLIYREIVNEQDEPILTWKTQISLPRKQGHTLHLL